MIIEREHLYVLKEDGPLIPYDEYEEQEADFSDSLVIITKYNSEGNPEEWMPYTL